MNRSILLRNPASTAQRISSTVAVVAPQASPHNPEHRERPLLQLIINNQAFLDVVLVLFFSPPPFFFLVLWCCVLFICFFSVVVACLLFFFCSQRLAIRELIANIGEIDTNTNTQIFVAAAHWYTFPYDRIYFPSHGYTHIKNNTLHSFHMWCEKVLAVR